MRRVKAREVKVSDVYCEFDAERGDWSSFVVLAVWRLPRTNKVRIYGERKDIICDADSIVLVT